MTLAQLRAMSAEELLQKGLEFALEEGLLIEERDGHPVAILDDLESGEVVAVDLRELAECVWTTMRRAIL